MKKIFYSFLLILLCSFSALCQLNDSENKALDELIAELVEIEASAINSLPVKQVFDAHFFTVKRTPLYKNNNEYSEIVLMKQKGKMLEVDEPGVLVPVIRSSFTLTTMNDAEILRAALAALLNQGFQRIDEMSQKGTQWLIVTEEWFGDKNGYVINTEKGGEILEMTYKSKLEL